MGIDIDPELVRIQARRHVAIRFGDAEDPEFLQTLPLGPVRWVISTARERDVNLTLIKSLRRNGFQGGIAVTATDAADVSRLETAGADLVLRPFVDAAARAVDEVLGQA